MNSFLIYVGAFLLSMITLAGDVCLKEATLTEFNRRSLHLLLLTTFLWSFSAWGWYFIIKYTSLFQAGIIFTMVCLIIGSGISILWYKEPAGVQEYCGLAFAVLALCLMAKVHQ